MLLLLPAAVLVFLILGGLAVDFTSAWAAERALANAAAAAANDAASRAVDLETFYGTGELRLLAGEAGVVAERSVAGAGLERLEAEVVGTEVTGLTVRVTVRGRARYLFGSAVPGGADGAEVEATATVTAREPGD